MRYACEHKPMRYSLSGRILPPDANGVIYWHIENFTEDQEKHKTITAFHGAFDILADYMWPITFRSSKERGDITIRFRLNNDEDLPEPFDEGVLAYAFLPGWIVTGKPP